MSASVLHLQASKQPEKTLIRRSQTGILKHCAKPLRMSGTRPLEKSRSKEDRKMILLNSTQHYIIVISFRVLPVILTAVTRVLHRIL